MLKRKFLQMLALAFLVAGVSSCNFLNGNYLGYILNNGTGSAATAGTGDELSDQESQLFSDGPIDIPVSIAKLDSPDTDRISVDATSTASPSSTAFLVADSDNDTLLNATSTDELSITVTGASGCIGSVDATPYVVAYRMVDYVVDESSETIVSVNDDGSFSLQMDVPSREQVIYAAMAADRATTSPFTGIIADLDIIEQNNGLYMFVDTNSNDINTNQDMTADRAGYYYMTLDSDDGHYFFRRNIDGTPVQFLIEASDKVIYHLSASNGNKVTYIDQNGDIYLLLPSTETSASLSLQRDPLMATVAQSAKLIAHIDHFDPFKGSLFMTDDGSGIVYGQNDDFPVLKFFRTSSDFKADLIPPGVFDDVKAHYAPNVNYLYLFVKAGPSYSLNRMDLSGPIGRAWVDREILSQNMQIQKVISMNVSDVNSMVAEVVQNNVDTIFYHSENDGLVLVHGNDGTGEIYHNPKMSMDGEILVMCEIHDTTEGTGNQLVYTRVSDSSHTFYPLTSDPDFSTCQARHGSFYIDQNNYIHFYRSAIDGSSAQHAMMNINALY